MHGDQVSNIPSTRDSPVYLQSRLFRQPERNIAISWSGVFPTQERSEDKLTASVFRRVRRDLSVSLSPPTRSVHSARITAAPPSSTARPSRPVLGLRAPCCRWLTVSIYSVVPLHQRTGPSRCRETKENDAPRRYSAPLQPVKNVSATAFRRSIKSAKIRKCASSNLPNLKPSFCKIIYTSLIH